MWQRSPLFCVLGRSGDLPWDFEGRRASTGDLSMQLSASFRCRSTSSPWQLTCEREELLTHVRISDPTALSAAGCLCFPRRWATSVDANERTWRLLRGHAWHVPLDSAENRRLGAFHRRCTRRTLSPLDKSYFMGRENKFSAIEGGRDLNFLYWLSWDRRTLMRFSCSDSNQKPTFYLEISQKFICPDSIFQIQPSSLKTVKIWTQVFIVSQTNSKYHRMSSQEARWEMIQWSLY